MHQKLAFAVTLFAECRLTPFAECFWGFAECQGHSGKYRVSGSEPPLKSLRAMFRVKNASTAEISVHGCRWKEVIVCNYSSVSYELIAKAMIHYFACDENHFSPSINNDITMN